jgi:hypothetical protein
MSNELKTFMVKLAGDLDCLTLFMVNPREVLARSGLEKEDQEALLSGDQNRIYWALSGAKVTPMPAAPAAGAQQAQPSVLPNVAPTISGGSAQYPPQIVTAVVWLYQAMPPFQQAHSAPSQGWPQFYYYPISWPASPGQPQGFVGGQCAQTAQPQPAGPEPPSPAPAVEQDDKTQASGAKGKRGTKRKSK